MWVTAEVIGNFAAVREEKVPVSKKICIRGYVNRSILFDLAISRIFAWCSNQFGLNCWIMHGHLLKQFKKNTRREYTQKKS